MIESECFIKLIKFIFERFPHRSLIPLGSCDGHYQDPQRGGGVGLGGLAEWRGGGGGVGFRRPGDGGPPPHPDVKNGLGGGGGFPKTNRN